MPLCSQERQKEKKKETGNMILVCFFLLPLMYGQGISEDFTITPIKYNTGLYYEKMQRLRWFRTQWRLVTSLELATYLKEEPEIEKHARQAENLCAQRGLTPCPTEEYVPSMLQKLEDSQKYRDMLNAMLQEHRKDHLRGSRKTRNAPLSFIGTISKVLFGTLTEEDEQQYHEALDTLYAEKNSLAEIISNQTHIIRSEFNNFHLRVQNLTAQTRTLSQKSDIMAGSLQETHKAIRRVKIESLIRTWMQTLDSAVEKYRSHLIVMVDAILFAKQGLLHPAILAPRQLLSAAQKVKNTTTCEFPLTPEELLSQQTNGITELQIAYSKGRILFQLTVPLLEAETFDLYRIHSNPSTQKHGNSQLTIYVKAVSPFLAISTTKQRYVLPSASYMQNCYRHHKQHICQASLPMYRIETRPICEIELLKRPTQNTWQKCDVQISATTDEIWEPLESGQTWLYYAKTERRVQFFCKGRSVGMDYIQNAGLIRLKPGCMATTDFTQIQAANTVITMEEQLYTPEIAINLTRLAPDFGSTHLDVLVKTTQPRTEEHPREDWLQTQAAISLKTLEEKAQQVQGHVNLVHSIRTGTYTAGGTVTLIVLGLIIYGVWKARFFGATQKRIEKKKEKSNTIPKKPSTDHDLSSPEQETSDTFSPTLDTLTIQRNLGVV